MAPARILIAEDEVIFAEDLEERVQGFGYVVVANVTTTEAALRSAAQDPPDLVLMDIRLAGEMDGIDAADELRSKSNIPVVFITAHEDEERLKRAKLSTPFGYLLKPIEDQQLEITIEMALYTSEVDNKRTKAELALRESEEKFRSLFHNAGIGMFRTRFDGSEILDANDTFIRMFGWTREEMVGKPSVMHWDDPREREEMARRLTAEGQVSIFECRMLTKTGDVRHCLTSLKLYRTQGILEGTILDITDRKQAEEKRRKLEAQVQQTQKLESLGVLAGGIAHDFNNILTGLLSNVDLALGDLPTQSPTRALLLDVEKAGRRAAELTGQMLAYSGKGKFVIEEIDLSALVQDMSSLLGSATTKKVDLSYHLAADLPAVKADVTQLRQIVLNLVSNASEAVGDVGGQVRVVTYAIDGDHADFDAANLAAASPDGVLAEGRYVALEVTDSGCGMDDETQAKIFDPFFTTKLTGRGLGLAALQGIVRGHEGAVLVESAPGKGTTFKVLLPALDHPAEAVATAAKTEGAWQAAGTILVVDDEEMVRTVATRMLERAGLRVLAASDGVEAVARFREHHGEIACVILDLNMPHMDGEQTFEELRKIKDDVPIILSSGYSKEESTKRFAGKGLAGFLQKPYEGATLRKRVREALASGK